MEWQKPCSDRYTEMGFISSFSRCCDQISDKHEGRKVYFALEFGSKVVYCGGVGMVVAGPITSTVRKP